MTLSLVCGLAMAAVADECVPVGRWAVASDSGPMRVSARSVFEGAGRRAVVLLGESHDRVEHHRWQLQTMAALQVQGEGIVLALEMFPRRVQPVLDAWVAGGLAEAEFLERSEWKKVWGFDAALYLPLLHFARMNRVPMVAMNVERALVREVGQRGYDAVPEKMREGVGPPAPAPVAYLQRLHEIYQQHATTPSEALDDPAFLRFVAAQQTWDRAMAEAIAAARVRHPDRQVVAVLGRMHAVAGAVPHQLRDLGVTDVAVLLPWDRDAGCEALTLGAADAVFGVEAPRASASPPSVPGN